MQTTQGEPSFRRLIGTGMAAKLIVDMGAQIFNPFLSIISAGLGISVVQMGRLVGLRSAMGIFAPLSGALADRYGFRRIIRSALLTAAAGFLLLGLSTSLWMVVLALALSGLGMGAFVPNLQAYVSGHLPYKLRARGLGMIEYSWALTGIVGLSLIGFLIAATGWRTPFFLLSAGMAGMSLLFGILPGEQRMGASAAGPGGAGKADMESGTAAGATRRPPLLKRIAAMAVIHTNRRSTYATMLAGALSYFAASQIMIAHGAWLTMEYGLDAAALGMVALVFGCFDLAASVTVSLVADRLGKKRSVLIGIVGSLVFYILMPLVDRSLIPTVLVIAGARMFFEFNIVSHFPLLSEQVPDQRGRAMSLSAAITLLAGTAAGFTGPWLLVNLGIPALALTSAAAVSLSLIVAIVLVKEQAHGRVGHGAV